MAGYTAPYYYQGFSPQDQARLQSSWDLGADWQFDLTLRYVDSLTDGTVPRYVTMDLRLAWKPNECFEAALIGRNLLDNHHAEWGTPSGWWPVNEVPRSIYASATWRYY